MADQIGENKRNLEGQGWVFTEANEEREAAKTALEQDGWEIRENAQGLKEADIMRQSLEEQEQINARLQADKKRSIFGREKADSGIMQQIKQEMQQITVRLREPMADDITDFRKQLSEMVQRYTSLIESCDSYLHKDRRGREALVKEVKKAAEKGRICFTNVGASDRIHEKREGGALLGNVLGNMETYYETVDTNFAVTAQLEEQSEGEDFLRKSTLEGEYLLSKDKNRFDDELRRCQLSNILSDFLGVDNIRRTQLVKATSENGNVHFGIKRERKYNDTLENFNHDEDLTISQLREKYEDVGGIKLVYSPDAIRQLSVIQVMNALLGRTNFNPEQDMLLITQNNQGSRRKENEEPHPEVIHVTGVYMDNAFGDAFHRGAMGNDLKRGKGGLDTFKAESIPVLDQEFALAVINMQPGDLAFMAKNLITPGEERAFESRLKYVQDVLREKLVAEAQLPEKQQTGLERKDWEKAKTLNKLQTALKTGENVRNISGIYGSVDRIEGVYDGASDEEIYYDKIYLYFRDQLKNAPTPAEKYRILAHINAGYQEALNMSDSTYKLDRGKGDQLRTRLLEEFLTPEVIEARQRLQVDNARELKRLFGEKTLEINEIPEEFVNREGYEEYVSSQKMFILQGAQERNEQITEEEALTRARAKADEKLKYNYIKYLILRDNRDLALRMDEFLAITSAITQGGINNRRMEPGNKDVNEDLRAIGTGMAKEFPGDEYLRLMDFASEFSRTPGFDGFLKDDMVKDTLESFDKSRFDYWESPVREFGLKLGINGPQQEAPAQEQQAPVQQEAQVEAPAQQEAQVEAPAQEQQVQAPVQEEIQQQAQQMQEAQQQIRAEAMGRLGEIEIKKAVVTLSEKRGQEMIDQYGKTYKETISEKKRKKNIANSRSRLYVKDQNKKALQAAMAAEENRQQNEDKYGRDVSDQKYYEMVEDFLRIDTDGIDMSSDAAIIQAAARLESINAKRARILELSRRNQKRFEELSPDVKKKFDNKMKIIGEISTYYRVCRMIITDDYYSTHYDEELGYYGKIDDDYKKQRLSLLLQLRIRLEGEMHVILPKAVCEQKSIDNVDLRTSQEEANRFDEAKKQYSKGWGYFEYGKLNLSPPSLKFSAHHDKLKEIQRDRDKWKALDSNVTIDNRTTEESLFRSVQQIIDLRALQGLGWPAEKIDLMIANLNAKAGEGVTEEEAYKSRVKGAKMVRDIMMEQARYIKEKYGSALVVMDPQEAGDHYDEVLRDMQGLTNIIEFLIYCKKTPEMFEHDQDMWNEMDELERFCNAVSFFNIAGFNGRAGADFDPDDNDIFGYEKFAHGRTHGISLTILGNSSQTVVNGANATVEFLENYKEGRQVEWEGVPDQQQLDKSKELAPLATLAEDLAVSYDKALSENDRTTLDDLKRIKNIPAGAAGDEYIKAYSTLVKHPGFVKLCVKGLSLGSSDTLDPGTTAEALQQLKEANEYSPDEKAALDLWIDLSQKWQGIHA